MFRALWGLLLVAFSARATEWSPADLARSTHYHHKHHHHPSAHDKAMHVGGAHPSHRQVRSGGPRRHVQPFAAPRWTPEAAAAAIGSNQPINFAVQQGSSEAAVPTMEESVAKATAAAEGAATAVKEISLVSASNNEFIAEARGQASEAKVALENAQEAAAEAKQLVVDTRVEAAAAAKQAASEYYAEVKQAAADALKGNADAIAKAKAAAALGKAKAGLAAAEPYYNAMIRGQKVMAEYQTRGQELAAASNALKTQSMQMASMANGYQWVGQHIQARQMMAQAHALMNEAERAKSEAQRLHGIEENINGLIPAYNEGANAALSNAQAMYNGVTIPDPLNPYFLQKKSQRHEAEATR